VGEERERIERLDGELRRVAEAADALVRGAQDLRAALDSLADDLRELARETADRAAVPETEPAAPETEPPASTADDGAVPEGARLVALDMVLEGAPRDDVAARLREEFDLADPGRLLDDVYARVGR